MSASQARRFACNANLIPLVLDGDTKILDLGMSKRLYNRYQRIALATRDKGCTWRGCDRPPAWCEAHHLTWYSHDGPTNMTNGALFCFYHHHLLHNGEWDAHMGTDANGQHCVEGHPTQTHRPLSATHTTHTIQNAAQRPARLRCGRHPPEARQQLDNMMATPHHTQICYSPSKSSAQDK